MKRAVLTAGIILALGLGTAACGADEETEAASGNPATTSASQAPAGENFGPGCAAVPKDGPGSFTGMAADPVATAASNNPVLSTLVTAVKKAGLVDTLNSAQDITVFAPANDAFAKIPEADLNKVLADEKTLTGVLTYHVVEGRKTPADLASGSFKTLQGGTVTAKGGGTDYTVNGAKVVCGNVQTGNATVYIIDTVLMPAK
ncbi:fasciclin domain-containing protein [Actinocorallia populi]|uniref:fasciclin domain-containing protein n=1 Tax=Actinocorallia populi TaxID=2079200 RepID=UPI000D093FAF|nr:fasciclin domain-containing protein [Actinocorallia populi]